MCYLLSRIILFFCCSFNGRCGMLKEADNVSQHPGEGVRRWFLDDYFDLIVWYENNIISGFQLCYDKHEFERCLTWKSETGFSHNKIDGGETPGQMKMSPILVPDGLFDNQGIADRFMADSRQLPPDLAGFIYQKLLEARVN